MNGKKWIRTLFIIFIIVISIISGFNYIVDPYRIYNNHVFNQYILKDRITNSVNMKINQYDNIIIGTSRTQGGIDVVNKYFKGTTYNASMSGTNVYEIHKALNYIYDNQHNVKEIIYGLDFLTFNNKRYPSAEFNQSLYNEENSYTNLLFTTVLSTDTFKDSLKTTIKHLTHNKNIINNGYKNKNHRSKYNYKNAAKEILTNNFLVSDGTYGCYTYGLDRLKLFQHVLIKAVQNNKNLKLFITPLQYRHIMALKHLGLFNLYIQWIYDLKFIVDNINNKYSSNIALYDFSYVNSINTESIYKKDDNQYYWESSHYKSKVGSIIIESMSGKGEFGILLNNINIDTYLRKYINDYYDLFRVNHDEYLDIYNLYELTTDRRITTCSKYDNIDTILYRSVDYNIFNSYNEEKKNSIRKLNTIRFSLERPF